MKLLNTISVEHQGCQRQVMLFVGDLTRIPAEEAVDVLVVSAFPDSYAPTPTSLVGALYRRGFSVEALAMDKEVDLRRFSSCWLSRPIESEDAHFRRILCFEPRYRGRATEVVGDIFRSIVPFTTGRPPVSQIALPLVASGHQREPAGEMLSALVEASVHWLSVGLPLERIKIVLHPSADVAALEQNFAELKKRYARPAIPLPPHPFAFDVFVSYSHQNRDAVDSLVARLRAARPALRVFLDRQELQAGAAWQQHIFDSLDRSRKVICVYSPDYLASRVCKEEFNIALFRHRDSGEGVLLPVYLFTAELPTYMKMVQYEDAREGDQQKISRAAEALLVQL